MRQRSLCPKRNCRRQSTRPPERCSAQIVLRLGRGTSVDVADYFSPKSTARRKWLLKGAADSGTKRITLDEAILGFLRPKNWSRQRKELLFVDIVVMGGRHTTQRRGEISSSEFVGDLHVHDEVIAMWTDSKHDVT